MADIYARSTDGSDADDGSTWALAKATLAGAAAINAAGDTIYVSDAHSESTAAAVTIAIAGSLASPTRVICADDAAEPPTAVSTAGVVATTGANSISITGNAYIYGLTFTAGSSTNNASLKLGTSGNFQRYDNCVFELGNTNTSARISVGSANYSNDMRMELRNCQFKFGATTQYCQFFGRVQVVGCSLDAGSAAAVLFADLNASGEAVNVLVESCDLSGLGSSASIFNVSGPSPASAVIRNCKLPASWSGQLRWSAVGSSMSRVSMYNCDSGDTNYRLWIETYAGTITNETTIVRTGGASDGTTTISWKMVSTANAEYPLLALESDEIVRWNETTGSAITATVEIVTDNVTLTDEECWLEVQYLGTSGYPLGSCISDAKADVLATAANQTTSSETWTTTGLTTPVKQKLSVTFTPQEKGYIHAVVKLAKASTTVYICPKVQIS